MEASKKFSLNGADLKSILWGLFDTSAGAALTYLSEVVLPGITGPFAPVIVVVAAGAIKAARKWLADGSIPADVVAKP